MILDKKKILPILIFIQAIFMHTRWLTVFNILKLFNIFFIKEEKKKMLE